LDTYKQQRNQKKATLPALDNLVDRIFKQNKDHQDYASIIGLALDTRRIDMVEEAIKAQTNLDMTSILIETLTKVWESQLDVEFRAEVLDLIFRLFERQPEGTSSQSMAMKVIAMCQVFC
jgi:26S proteasome regulatory subunit N2